MKDYQYNVTLSAKEKIDVETGLLFYIQYLKDEIKKNLADSAYCAERRQYLQKLLDDVRALMHKI